MLVLDAFSAGKSCERLSVSGSRAVSLAVSGAGGPISQAAVWVLLTNRYPLAP